MARLETVAIQGPSGRRIINKRDYDPSRHQLLEGAPERPRDGFDPTTATKADLQAKADELGLDVQGTGASGNVTAEDLRSAVRDALEGER